MAVTVTQNSSADDPLLAPLTFRPVYLEKVWGGRQMERYREDLPPGLIGESWDIADHDNGMSIVASGALEGQSLRELTVRYGSRLVGPGFAGAEFPLLIKLLNAKTRLSVQVHPDDQQARAMGVADRGKTECWHMLADGGELFVGVRPGVDATAFREALDNGRVESTLRRYVSRAGDFVFLGARTVHALGAGSLLYEVQQTCDVTFRVWDWGRVGLDGKPRQLHVEESIQTIDFEQQSSGPVQPEWRPHPQSGEWRPLAQCEYFTVDELRGSALIGGDSRACSIVIALAGNGELHTRGGAVRLRPAQSALVSAAAGEWHVRAHDGSMRLLVARPRW